MRIKSLTLQNIRSYVEQTIEFPEGSVLLAGDIGAGKSTILLAIEYAFFGTKRGELEASSLLRYGSHAGRIELNCDINGNTIKISRTLKRTSLAIKQEAGYIVINGTRVDATPLELRSRVMDLLGYPKESQLSKDLIYRYTVFTPQEQMRQIIYENKEERLNILRKIFNIDKYKKITENAQFVAKELRAKKRALEETLSDISAIEQQRNVLGELQKEKEQQHTQHFLQLQQIQETAARIKKDIEIAEAQQKKIQELRQTHAVHTQELKKNTLQQSSLKLKLHQFQEQKETLSCMQIVVPEKPTCKTRADLEQEKESAEKCVQEMQQTAAVRSEQKKTVEEKLQQLKQQGDILISAHAKKTEYEQQQKKCEEQIAQKEHVQQLIEDAELQLQTCHESLAGAEVRKNTARVTVENMNTLDVCTLCLQQVDHQHKEKIILDQTTLVFAVEKELEHFTAQKNIFRRTLEEAKKQMHIILAAEQKNTVLISLLVNLSEKEKELQHNQQEYSILEHTLQEFKPVDELLFAEKQQCVVKLKGLLHNLTAWETAVQEQKNMHAMIQDKETQQKDVEAEILHFKEEQKTLQQYLFSVEQELVQFKDVETTLAMHKQELQKIQHHEKQCEIILATIGKEQQHLAQQIETKHAEIQKQNSLLEKIKKINASAQWIEDYFVALVQTMEKHVFLQVHSSFNQNFTQWFATLIGDSMSARLDEEFTPIIEQNGYDAEVVHLSGGEKTAVSLAYRLALNKVVNDFISTIATKDFIILDEPTEGFSSEQLDTVREVLDVLGLKQIILVSHEQKIESFVEHVIRIEKQGHVSRVV